MSTRTSKPSRGAEAEARREARLREFEAAAVVVAVARAT
jgi:hypothetical protein